MSDSNENNEFKGVPLDTIQNGYFTYPDSSEKYTLGDYAKEMREDLQKSNNVKGNEDV